MSEHRVPMLGTSWRRYEDPVKSRDARVRAVVGALAQLPSPEPRPEFRSELRAQLVAIAPRVISENAPTAQATAPLHAVDPTKAAHGTARPRHTDSVLARLRGIRLGRPLAVVASVVTAFALLFGGAVWMSQKALPGDALYGLKRASESWELATAGSPTDKARDYLKFAQTRVDEATALAQRASASAAGAGPQAGGFDAHATSLISSTLASADHDVRSASTLLGSQAVRSRSSSPLSVLTSWAPGQLGRVRDLSAMLPAGALRNRTLFSAQLVRAAVNRAMQLAAALPTGCPNLGNADELGPLPVTDCTTGRRVEPKRHTKTRPHRTTARHVSATGEPKSNAPGRPGTPGAAGSTGSSSGKPTGSPSPSSPPPIVKIPTLPPPTSLPVTVNSCGVGVTLGPIGIGVGVCPSH